MHIEVQGMILKSGSAIITSSEDHTDLKIEELFVYCSNVILGLQCLNVKEYSELYHSWIVEPSNIFTALHIKDLQSRQILTLRPVRGTHWTCYFITLKCAV